VQATERCVGVVQEWAQTGRDNVAVGQDDAPLLVNNKAGRVGHSLGLGVQGPRLRNCGACAFVNIPPYYLNASAPSRQCFRNTQKHTEETHHLP